MFGGLNLLPLNKIIDEARLAESGQTKKMISPPYPPSVLRQTVLASIKTGEVIDSFLKSKKSKRAKESTLKTYEKRLRQFKRQFPFLPEKAGPIDSYLDQFNGPTGRYRRNHYDLLTEFYEHAVRRFGLRHNPMDDIERTMVSPKPIRTASLEQAVKLFQAAETPGRKSRPGPAAGTRLASDRSQKGHGRGRPRHLQQSD